MAVQNSDIQFLYTTPTYTGPAVTDASLSAGGYASASTVVWNNLFNARFGSDLTQYRCIAVKNTNTTDTCYSPRFYLKETSLNPAAPIQMAVEVPPSGALKGSIYYFFSNSFTDQNFPQQYPYPAGSFTNCKLTFVSTLSVQNRGAIREVSGYDPTEAQTIFFAPELAFPCSQNDTYTIDAGPAQCLTSSIVSPNISSPHFSGFGIPTTTGQAIGININGRFYGADLKPNDVVYVWFKRTLTKNMPPFPGNRIMLGMTYTDVTGTVPSELDSTAAFDDTGTTQITAVYGNDSDVYVGRSDGALLKGSRTVWQSRRVFDASEAAVLAQTIGSPDSATYTITNGVMDIKTVVVSC